MTTQPPQVLSRRSNGAPTLANQANESAKGKARGGHDNNAPTRSGRGRGANSKSADASKNANESESSKPAKPKPQNEGEKLVIRRLPPGMTQTEFASILGPDWEMGKGKVDWFHYAPGKISLDPSKPSRPARAYVHLMRKEDILTLSDAVRTSTWEDAKSSFNSPSLVGPPSLEFAIYKKVPGNKKRTDARQGTIDQDPEFMAFLEDLANPAPPKEISEAEDDEAAKAEAKITTTPLIEFLKEKKASKGKDSSSNKRSKEDSRSGKGKAKDDDAPKKKGRESRNDRDKAPKETVKILTKKNAAEQPVSENAKSSDKNNAAGQDAPKSRRAGIAAAARILQRDLGLSPGSAHRKARQDAAKAESDGKGTQGKETTPAPNERPASPAKPAETAQTTKKGNAASAPSKTQTTGRRNRGGKNAEKNKAGEGTSTQGPTAANPPIVLLKKKGSDTETAQPAPSNTPTKNANQTSQPKSAGPPSGPKGAAKSGQQKKAPNVTADATRAFVKHANPSQGVTEALLKQALEIHGAITFVEIDKRKGFAYVDFADHDSLVKAVSASPVSVAQGTVQVLERKDKKPANANNANANINAKLDAQVSNTPTSGAPEKPSGRGRRGRGGGNKANANANNNSNQAAAATPAASAGG